jgi:asparagine synthase (glutamine-hydrolysing)
MCGITGFISTKPLPNNVIEPMTDSIIARGPDGHGYHYGDHFVFGHRRLSIVDLSEAGHQPMRYLDRYIITFNGEIYNHIELRNELIEQGYSFNSHTDTEVIMAAYDHWGVASLSHFNGMWAFALYDTKTKQFFISRDRFGKKPLYYYSDKNNFIFASEIKAILLHPDVTTKPNIDFLNHFLKYGCKEYLAETAFTNIYRFEASSYFLGTAKELMNNFSAQKFWEIHPNLSHEKFDEKKAIDYARRYYELLEDAVRIRLRADVKVGSALSGGLDSSSIVYLVNKLLKEQGKEDLQETFSSVYKSTGTEHCDESDYINLMAAQLGVHSNQIEPIEFDIPAEHDQMIYALENPPENSLMSSWYTFKLVASTDVKVTLDGQGADEQLSGYLPYLMNYISSLNAIDMFQETYRCLSIPQAQKYVLIGFGMGIFRILFGQKFLLFILTKVLKKNFEPNLNQKLANDTRQSLVTLIHYADHTSMAYSIESRMPFMDYRLVEFLASVPACYKMHHGWTKYLARLAFDGKLPDEVNWRRDKMGWPIPEQKWFEGNLKSWFNGALTKSAFFSKLTIPKENNTERIFAQKVRCMNASRWYYRFFESKESL